MAVIEVRNVSKIYQAEGVSAPALQNITLNVNEGEFVALVGRSGCGKSTLLNLCGAMDFPTSGEVSIGGAITSRLDDAGLTRLRREKVGFIFQSFQLMNTLTVAENVELPLMLARKPSTRAAALERLSWVEMSEYSNRYPHQLSGGQQQRVAIARALVHNPRVLLADEPTGNLDTVTGELILQVLQRTSRECGVAIIMATHSAESTACAGSIIRLRDGRTEGVAVSR